MENELQPDLLKQAQDIIFSRKIIKTNHPTLIFNDNPVHQLHYKNILECF